jgi:hypothetical protein
VTIPFWVGLGFSAFAIYMLKHAIGSYSASKSSLLWPHVDGVILESRAVKWEATSNSRTLFVKYEYVVSGKRYNGTRVSFYTLVGNEVLQMEKQHNASKSVPVYYNPQAPDESTLIVGPRNEKGHSDLILATIALNSIIRHTSEGWYPAGVARMQYGNNVAKSPSSAVLRLWLHKSYNAKPRTRFASTATIITAWDF